MTRISSLLHTGADALDTIVRVTTPERIVFDYPLGGPFRRFCAYLVDMGLVVSLVIAAVASAMTLAMGTSAGVGLALVAFFVITWGYGAFCEGVFNGQTLGKRLMSLRVLSERGVPISAAQAIVRNLVGTVDGPMPFCFLLALTSMMLSRKFQRLGDLAAGTMVIVEERRPAMGLVRIRDRRVRIVRDRLPIRVSVRPRLARALSDYVRRRHRFGPGLRDELAEPLARPLRARFGLSREVEADTVLCAVYERVFLGD